MNKNIITLDGYDEIIRIFNKLIKEKEYWVVEKQIAAQQGDRSENAEYIASKENIRNIDKRLYRLNFIINRTTSVDIKKRKTNDKVLFGSTIKVLRIDSNDNEEELFIKIVGTYELIYIQKTTKYLCISNISPLGSKLMRKEVGDDIELNGFEYEILEIKD